MLALTSAPSDGKVNQVQKCSLIRVRLSRKRVKGGMLKVLAVEQTSS